MARLARLARAVGEVRPRRRSYRALLLRPSTTNESLDGQSHRDFIARRAVDYRQSIHRYAAVVWQDSVICVVGVCYLSAFFHA